MTASRECQLADGRSVVLRSAGPGDVPAIAGLYLELSPESFYRRFNMERPAHALVAQLASFGGGAACLVAAASSDPGRVDATITRRPSGWGEQPSGVTRSTPDLAPMWWMRVSVVPAQGPPTRPWFARNSLMISVL